MLLSNPASGKPASGPQNEDAGIQVLLNVIESVSGASDAEKRDQAKRRARELLESDPGLVARIAARLNTADDEERAKLLSALWYLGDKAGPAIPALMELFDQSEVPEEGRVFSTLLEIGEPVVPAMIERLSGADAKYRLAATTLLEQLGPRARASVPALLDRLRDKDDRVMLAAGLALRRIEPGALRAAAEAEAVIPRLVSLLDREHDIEIAGEQVKIAAAAAIVLGFIGPKAAPAAMPGMVRLGFRLNQDNDQLGIAFAGAIEQMVPAAAPQLLKLLDEKDPQIRQTAASLLGRTRVATKADVPELAAALKNPDPAVVHKILDALAKLGPDAQPALPALQRLATEGDREIRPRARNVIKDIQRGHRWEGEIVAPGK